MISYIHFRSNPKKSLATIYSFIFEQIRFKSFLAYDAKTCSLTREFYLIFISDLFDFSPNPPGAVVALLNQGTYIKCNPPSAKPGNTYMA